MDSPIAPHTDPLESARRYLRSYGRMRTAIGVIGVLLPVVLLVGDVVFLDGDMLLRGSLSAYYHSGMRDVWVGALAATALFLVNYRVEEQPVDNRWSTVAGVAALGVALFPTNRPPGTPLPPTPLQAALGERLVATIHFTSAAVFIVSLAIISVYFGRREMVNRARTPAAALAWRNFHWGCAAVIGVALVAMVASQATGIADRNSLLFGEIVAVVAFGASWLAKGLRIGEPVGRRARDVSELPAD
ncbi:MAG: hypothetical protein ACT4RN_15345 [Pseudonocardia sp.]